MEIMKNRLIIIICFLCFHSFSQTIKGVVLDAKTQQPIESAAVYFDNTTIGTSTNSNGEFEIEENLGIRSPLIISFLGYEKLTLSEYNSDTFYKIVLEERNNVLDEVVIIADDGMSRAQKLDYFRSQFLGKSRNAKSCKILNEDDLVLRFNKKTKQLTASSASPLVIENKNLGYKIQYDIKDFILDFGYVNFDTKSFVIESLYYAGTSFYESLDDDNAITRKRNRVYKGSMLHFMRALARQELEEEDYAIFSKRFKVDPEKYISVTPIKMSDSVEVKLRLPLSVVYKKKHQTELLSKRNILRKNQAHQSAELAEKTQDTISVKEINIHLNKSDSKSYFNTTIYIDGFGNYSPIKTLNLIGHMSELRIGDTLPLDYEVTEDDK